MPLFRLPPGPTFILNQLFSWKFASFASSVYLVRVGTDALGFNVPIWAIVSCSVIAVPFIFIAQGEHQSWKDKRRAASLGARLAPMVPTKSVGGFDLIAAWSTAFQKGYIGDYTSPHLAPIDSPGLS